VFEIFVGIIQNVILGAMGGVAIIYVYVSIRNKKLRDKLAFTILTNMAAEFFKYDDPEKHLDRLIRSVEGRNDTVKLMLVRLYRESYNIFKNHTRIESTEQVASGKKFNLAVKVEDVMKIVAAINNDFNIDWKCINIRYEKD
jgi:hypothetical protein